MNLKDLVRNLQIEMNKQGESLTLDGDFGPKTQAALDKFTLAMTLSKKQKNDPILDDGDLPARLLINQNCLELICHFEGFFSKPYLDPVGIPTIGYGTIAYPSGEKVKMKDREISRAEAMEYMRFELDLKCTKIRSFILSNNIPCNENQFGALVSFAYNLGEGVILQDGRSMKNALLSKQQAIIADTFLIYDKAKGKTLPGLTRRRKAERHLYLNGFNKFDF